MKLLGFAAASSALLSTAVEARNLVRLPEATKSVVLPVDGMTPKPTPAPPMHEFMRRQDGGASAYAATVLVAPDNTCGYISGNASSAYTCYRTQTCGLVQSQPAHSGAILCFDTAGSNFRFGCVDYDGFFSSSSCNSACAQDTMVLKCTDKTEKYCNTIAFPGGITDYWCAPDSDSQVNKAFTTFNGETDSRRYSTFIDTDTAGSLLNTKQTRTGSVPGATAAANPSGTASGSAATATASSAGGSGDGSNQNKAPVGAIVGGVVGGVGAIGIAGIALFFFLRNKKKKQAEQEKTTSPSTNYQPLPPQQVPPQGMMPGQHQSYYDPKFGAVQGYASPDQQYPHGTPPPSGYYPVSNLGAAGTTSPAVSQMTDPRTTSPSAVPWGGYAAPPPGQQQHQHPPAGFQPQQPVIHEAPSQPSETNHGGMHELA